MITLLTIIPLALQPTELLPGVWVDEGVVEFDAKVAMDCHHPETPDVYLEMLVTGPDTREHESLLVTALEPSNLHAALLAAGFVHGQPVQFGDDGSRKPAQGDAVVISVRPSDGDDWINIIEWVIHVDQETKLTDADAWSGLVFAGSILTDEGSYKANSEGALISLTPWGFEVVSPVWTVSPHASQDEPVWIANQDLVPKLNAPVRVRITESQTPDETTEPSD
ncbi:MAG: hypothetical protein JJ974_09675 [Phycisphaerales bacterium]|nr:hypothetical protein [Phycisphaerales bacterium]